MKPQWFSRPCLFDFEMWVKEWSYEHICWKKNQPIYMYANVCIPSLARVAAHITFYSFICLFELIVIKWLNKLNALGKPFYWFKMKSRFNAGLKLPGNIKILNGNTLGVQWGDFILTKNDILFSQVHEFTSFLPEALISTYSEGAHHVLWDFDYAIWKYFFHFFPSYGGTAHFKTNIKNIFMNFY